MQFLKDGVQTVAVRFSLSPFTKASSHNKFCSHLQVEQVNVTYIQYCGDKSRQFKDLTKEVHTDLE